MIKNKKAVVPVFISTLICVALIIIMGFVLLLIIDNRIEESESVLDEHYLYIDSMASTRTILMHQTDQNIKVFELITKRVREDNIVLLIQELDEILIEINSEKRWIYRLEINTDGDLFVITNPRDNRLFNYYQLVRLQNIPNPYDYQIAAMFSMFTPQEYRDLVS